MSVFQKGLLLFIGVIFIASCQSDPFDIDIGPIDIDQLHLRIDKSLAEASSVEEGHKALFENHEMIYGTYFQNILQLGNVNESVAPNNMKGFLNDPMMKDVQFQVDSCFSQNEILADEFIDAFEHFKYYFPQDTVPDIVFYNSGFNYGIFPMPSFIGVGLEWYIGKGNHLLTRLPPAQFPKYLKDKMDEEYMVADALRGWLLVKNTDKIKGKELIDQLVYFGKIAYITKACLPGEEEHIKFGYQPGQFAWCEQNEFMIWKSLVNEDLLFTKDARTINSFTGNAPFTKGFSSESPGKIAFFIGYNMVEDFMKKNQAMDMTEMLNTDAKTILNAYRPKD